MLTGTVNEIKRKLKKDGFKALSEKEKKTAIEINCDLFQEPVEVANLATGVVTERMMINWKKIDWDFAEKVLKKAKRI